MSSSRKLLSALALVLLVLTVDSAPFGRGSSRRSRPSPSDTDLRGSELSTLLGSRVTTAERVSRPIGSSGSARSSARFAGAIGRSISPQLDASRHSGVRVTLEDGTKWLVHKGDGYGRTSQTVVTDDGHMSSAWRNDGPTRDFGGSKTVSDLIRTGGETYRLFKNNCHHAADRIMKLP